MDLSGLSKSELLAKCGEYNILNVKSKNKTELVQLITDHVSSTNVVIKPATEPEPPNDTLKNTVVIDGCLRLVDLFAGTGAFSGAFHCTSKVNTVFANDMLDSSKGIFDLNNSCSLTKGDLNDIAVNDIPAHDILTGGFPCQPFSIAGMQKGFEDARSNVFWKILSIIQHHKPRVVILENVKNLQSHDDGNTFKTIQDNLKKLGYFVKFKVLNTCKLTTIPQNRERIYIVCFTDFNLYERFNFDFAEQVNEPVANFLEPVVPVKYYYNDTMPIYNTINAGIVKNVNTNTIYQYRRYYVRENKNSVCPTLTANMGTGGHNVPMIRDDNGIRKLTPRECFNLQGFPTDYKLPKLSDGKLYSLAGNAVSVPIVKLLAKKIVDLICE